jgi:hypothetical protein
MVHLRRLLSSVAVRVALVLVFCPGSAGAQQVVYRNSLVSVYSIPTILSGGDASSLATQLAHAIAEEGVQELSGERYLPWQDRSAA